jgi:hypothetical protein
MGRNVNFFMLRYILWMIYWGGGPKYRWFELSRVKKKKLGDCMVRSVIGPTWLKNLGRSVDIFGPKRLSRNVFGPKCLWTEVSLGRSVWHSSRWRIYVKRDLIGACKTQGASIWRIRTASYMCQGWKRNSVYRHPWQAKMRIIMIFINANFSQNILNSLTAFYSVSY